MFVRPGLARPRAVPAGPASDLEDRRARARACTGVVLETGELQAAGDRALRAVRLRPHPDLRRLRRSPISLCYAKDLGAEPRARGPAKRPGYAHPAPRHLGPPRRGRTALAMWRDIEVRYPEIVAITPGGFDADDPKQGVGALSSVVAWTSTAAGRLRVAARRQRRLPGRFGRAEEGLGRRAARGSGAARALLAAIEDDARAHGLTTSSCRPASGSPRRSRCTSRPATARGPASTSPATSCRSGWPRPSERGHARSRRTASTRPPATAAARPSRGRAGPCPRATTRSHRTASGHPRCQRFWPSFTAEPVAADVRGRTRAPLDL